MENITEDHWRLTLMDVINPYSSSNGSYVFTFRQSYGDDPMNPDICNFARRYCPTCIS